MTEEDLDTLCLHLHELSLNDLQRLEGAGVLPSLRLRDTTEAEEAVCEIRSALEAVDSQEDRLRYLASLYCWLISQDKLRPWALFYLGEDPPAVADFTIHMLIATAIAVPGMDLTYVPISDIDDRYACVITAEPESDQQEHTVLCLYAWSDLPYLALATLGDLDAERLASVIQTVLGLQPEDLLLGAYTDLDDAFSAACRHFARDRR